jgi:TetR/AcrR family transcriptional repressor of nem operon
MKKGRPQKYDRKKVIEIARNMFWQTGYNSVSTQQLCRGTKLGKGSLYHAFKSKHHLFIITLEDYVKEGIRIQRSKVLENTSIKLGIDALLQWGINNDFNNNDTEGCYMINSYLEYGQYDPEVAMLMKEHMSSIKDIISTAFNQAEANGELIKSVYNLDELKERFLIDYYGFRLLNAIDDETAQTATDRKKIIIKTIFK